MVAPVAPLLRRAAGGIAFNQVNLAQRRISLLAISEFSRQRPGIERTLAACQIFGFAGRLAHARRFHAFSDDLLRFTRVFAHVARKFLVHQRFDDALHFAVAQLGLGLPLELRLGNFHADHRRQALAHVFALQILVVLFQMAAVKGVIVDRAGERGTKSDQMGATLDGVDVVGEGKNVFRVAVVPLHGNLDFDAVLLPSSERLLRGSRPCAIKMLHEGHQAALVENSCFFCVVRLDGDLDASIQERQLTQPLRKYIKAELRGLENLAIGLERHPRAALFRLAYFLQRSLRVAAPVALLVHLAVALDFDFERFRQRVDDRNTDTVQAAGNFVGSFVELAAGVQFGKHDFGGGNFLRGMNIDGNAAAVVDHGDAVIDMNGYFDAVTMTHQRFVDGVIDGFKNQMCRPRSLVSPIYMPGRFLTASRPSKLLCCRRYSRVLWGFYFSHFPPNAEFKFC